MKRRKIHITSLGCPKNRVDSEIIAAAFIDAGFSVCETPEAADVLLINTCAFITPAVEESIDTILAAARIKERNPAARLVVAGCLVERYGNELAGELPEVDLFVPSADIRRTAKLLAGEETPPQEKKPRGCLPSAADSRVLSTPPHRAYLKITEGCDNRCTYCLIPSLKGPLRSREVGDIVAEAVKLGESGVVELSLVGQDLTAFGRDRGEENGLETLLRELCAATAIPWIRLFYLYPGRLSDSLIRLIAEEEQLLPYFDIPLQHTSDRILRRMNRKYGLADIENLLAFIRETIPEAAIRTTLMTGFPGESDEDFAAMTAFLRKWRLDQVGVFAYCDEEGSPAANFRDKVDKETAEDRRKRLLTLQAEIAAEKLRKYRGKEVEVMVEGLSRESDLLLEGRTCWQGPEVDGVVYINSGECNAGDIVRIRVEETHTYDMVGGIVE